MSPRDQARRDERVRDEAAARVAEFKAALDVLKSRPEPDDYDAAFALGQRIGHAEGRLAFAIERLATAEAALAISMAAAELQDLLDSKGRLTREGDRLAKTWPARWDKAVADLVAVVNEMQADKRACDALSEKLRERGEVGLWSADQRLRHSRGLEAVNLAAELRLPQFGRRHVMHWPVVAREPMAAF